MAGLCNKKGQVIIVNSSTNSLKDLIINFFLKATTSKAKYLSIDEMKKLFKALFATILAVASLFTFTACDPNTIYVNTNAFFAPFEYYEGTNIVGVDVDIMNKVGEKLGKKVKFVNTDFDVIIDNVASGRKYDCGAAGITITDARKEKVAFSNPYYTSVQYVIMKTSDNSIQTKTATDGTECVFWSDLMTKKIGVQRDKRCVRRPYAENKSAISRMHTQKFICFIVRTLMK